MMRSNRFLWLLFTLSLMALFTNNETAAQSNILVVNSTSSSTTSGGCDADCSLLDAINQSNTMNGVQTIQFNMSGDGPFTIFTDIGFRIRQSTIIDATTQPGYNGKPLIQIQPSVITAPYGIYVEDVSSFDSTLSVTIRGVAINGFVNGRGILIGNGQNHLIEQNFIGVNAAGTLAQPNDTGIYMRARNSVIRQNVISGNNGGGVLLINSGDRLSINNQIVGNFVGTNFNGTAPIPNQDGIQIREGANNNSVGGIIPADRNIISGNSRWGIFTDGSDIYPSLSANTTTIQGNYIGTDVSGTLDLGNGSYGIFIQRSDNNVIGGTTGTSPGGNCSGACNLISGNNFGIGISGDEAGTAENNVVRGNFIGTTVTGKAVLPNSGAGISISSSANTIGGTTPSARNIISGNATFGIQLSGQGTFGNIIIGNYIGTDTLGLNDLGNQADGIYINGTAYGNQIGDGTDQGANWIGFNGAVNNHAGIVIDDTPVNGFYSDQNLITGNSIFYNGGFGIDLLPVGFTVNDAGDVDTGANGLQNTPVLSSIVARNTTTIDGTLNSAANRDYNIELFSSTDCDATGHGEGEFFLGAWPVTTNGSGNAAFQVVIPSLVEPNGAITATAIDQDVTLNSPFLGNTSEFSSCIAAQADLSITNVDSADPVLPGDSLTYTLSVSNPANASYADNVIVTDTLPVGLTFVSATASQGTCAFNTPFRKVTCTITQLQNSAAVTVAIATTVDTSIATTTLSNTAVVAADTSDPLLTNNTASQTTRIARANLSVTINDTPDPVPADTLLTYTVVVTNLGTDTATNVALTDTLPANISLISAVATQGSCTPGAGTINCSLGTIINSQTASVVILVRPNYQTQNTIIINTASVSALQVDTLLTNNTFSASTRVNASSEAPPLYLYTIATPTLTWNRISWAAGYEIEVADNSGFSNPKFDNNNISSADLSATTTPLEDGIWYWRVRAKHADESWGEWSAAARFMIDQP